MGIQLLMFGMVEERKKEKKIKRFHGCDDVAKWDIGVLLSGVLRHGNQAELIESQTESSVWQRCGIEIRSMVVI
jgi:hypothetical protein